LKITVEDRVEINDLLASYCFSLDDKDWGRFSGLFHEDAVLDFTAFGGPRAGTDDLIAFLKPILDGLHCSQHTISTSMLRVVGEQVEARTAAQVMMVSKPDGAEHVAFYGLWYRDRLVKASGRWLIKERVQQQAWTFNVPG
tara:strand:- start:5210 stop:5632 length:423 start_codon:yes stop_codon:yes gene_type:complete